MNNNHLEHVGVLGMKWGRRKAQSSSNGSDSVASTRVKGVSKQKISNVKRNLKTVALVGGVLGGTVGTIVAVKLMNKAGQKRAIEKAVAYTKKVEAQKAAKNVIYLPAHMSTKKSPTPYMKSVSRKNALKKMEEMDAIAGQLRRGEGRPRGDVPIRTWQEMERVASILRNGGLV